MDDKYWPKEPEPIIPKNKGLEIMQKKAKLNAKIGIKSDLPQKLTKFKQIGRHSQKYIEAQDTPMVTQFKSKIKDLKLETFVVPDMGLVTPEFVETLFLGLHDSMNSYLAGKVDMDAVEQENGEEEQIKEAEPADYDHPLLTLYDNSKYEIIKTAENGEEVGESLSSLEQILLNWSLLMQKEINPWLQADQAILQLPRFKVNLKDLAIIDQQNAKEGEGGGVAGQRTLKKIDSNAKVKRPAQSQPISDDEQIRMKEMKDGIYNSGGFAQIWFEKVGMREPTVKEIVEGVLQYLSHYYTEKMKASNLKISDDDIYSFQKALSDLFQYILVESKIENIEMQLLTEAKSKDGLYDPDGKVVMLVLFLISMEPHLLDSMSRPLVQQGEEQMLMDGENLKLNEESDQRILWLGPLSKSLNVIIVAAEFDRHDSRVTPGSFKYDPDDELEHDHGFLSGSHLVFKCCQLDPAELKHWTTTIGKPSKKMERVNNRWQKVDDPSRCGCVNIVGYTSAYESPDVAIETAKSFQTGSKDEVDKELVMFVICLQNYNSNGFKGFRLNDKLYSAHPDEQRIVLIDGVEMVVIKSEQVTIDTIENKNAQTILSSFEKPKLNILYLLNAYLT